MSATDAELAVALERTRSVAEHLTVVGWPAPVLAMSGNGYHLLYRVDLPADDGGLVKAVLAALADQFSDDAVTVDPRTLLPAEIPQVVETIAAALT